MAKYMAKGTVLKKGATAILQLTKINGMTLSRNTIDSSDHDTATAMTFLAEKLYDPGEVTFEGHFDPADATQGAGATGAAKDLTVGAAGTYSIVFPDAGPTTWTFSGYVTKFAPYAPYDGKLMFSGAIKVTGTPTLA